MNPTYTTPARRFFRLSWTGLHARYLDDNTEYASEAEARAALPALLARVDATWPNARQFTNAAGIEHIAVNTRGRETIRRRVAVA